MSCSTLEIHQTMIALSLFCVIRELKYGRKGSSTYAEQHELGY